MGGGATAPSVASDAKAISNYTGRTFLATLMSYLTIPPAALQQTLGVA